MTDLISTKKHHASLELAFEGRVIPILVCPSDWPGVLRASQDLGSDFGRVTGKNAVIHTSLPELADTSRDTTAILVGTRGKSACIDSLVSSGKIPCALFDDNPEAYLIQTVQNPFPGIDCALVIAGGDKRGTIFGIYEVSSQIGVSPWYWWADVPPRKSAELYANQECILMDSPKVAYRGIFLNDEFPSLTNWVREKYGEARVRESPPIPAGIANYGKDFYCRIFELLLRLKGNYLWPAMWNNAFNEDDPDNARLADEYGIIMGTSHQEPMLRAQKEWDRRFNDSVGNWNYALHPALLEEFWREGLERNKNFESIITLGLRGRDDTEMSPDGPEANRALLEKIVERQRNIITETTGKSAETVPQVWCLYKEIQEYYEDGMRVPEDITLLWSDDNWGNQRRLPTQEERSRPGGSGIYYHFDYHGGPRSYQWTNTITIAKIWDQMTLAREYGADRIWIVNVGHLKGYEYPLSFFMDMAWNPERYTGDSLGSYSKKWTASLFGEEPAGETAEILEKCVQYNARRKPELLSPNTWSLIHYCEAERVLDEWRALKDRAEKLYLSCGVEMADALYQLILFPVRASCLLNDIYISAGKNVLWANQGRRSANRQHELTLSFFLSFKNLIADYNTRFAEGKWAHFMDQAVLGYTGWADPPCNTLDHIKISQTVEKDFPDMGLALEGSAHSWPDSGQMPVLPVFDSFNGNERWIEIYNRGCGDFIYSVEPSASWILVDTCGGIISDQVRIIVSVDRDLAPPGTTSGMITVKGTGSVVTVRIRMLKIEERDARRIQGFVETDLSLSIEASHYTRNIPAQNRSWLLVEGFGKTLSGMRATSAPQRQSIFPDRDMPCLEYDTWFFHAGTARIVLHISPVLNFIQGESIRIGVGFDNQETDILVAVEADYRVTNENNDWAQCVEDSVRRICSTQCIDAPGAHTIKVWMISPGVVLERITVDMGGLRSSYLGPPESFRAGY